MCDDDDDETMFGHCGLVVDSLFVSYFVVASVAALVVAVCVFPKQCLL